MTPANYRRNDTLTHHGAETVSTGTLTPRPHAQDAGWPGKTPGNVDNCQRTEEGGLAAKARRNDSDNRRAFSDRTLPNVNRLVESVRPRRMYGTAPAKAEACQVVVDRPQDAGSTPAGSISFRRNGDAGSIPAGDVSRCCYSGVSTKNNADVHLPMRGRSVVSRNRTS